MLDVWVVPRYDSPQGVCSHDYAAIARLDGSFNTIPLNKIGNRSSVCVDWSRGTGTINVGKPALTRSSSHSYHCPSLQLAISPSSCFGTSSARSADLGARELS